ncbi:MAG: hypothetical protein M3132_04735 [Actinomycetia bacterium]|nr:hypothetical protein [Actinomycetes bacterium]
MWLPILGIALVVAGCGGGSSENSGFTVVSEDGMATLVIQEGSLPDDVSRDDVRIDWAEGQSDVAGAPLSAVRLLPSGLALSADAVVRIEIPDTVDQLLAVHSNGVGFEVVETAVETIDNKLVATVEIDHFSFLTLYGVNGLFVTAEATPASVAVDEFQEAYLRIEVEDGTFPLWINVGGFLENKFQQFVFRTQSIFPGFRDPTVKWSNGSALSEKWNPPSVATRVSEGELSFEALASSSCVQPNTDAPVVEARPILTMRLVSKGPVTDGSNLFLVEAFGTELGYGASNKKWSDDGFVPFTMRVDEEIFGVVTVTRRLTSECVGAAETSDTSSTSSTSLPPVEETATSFNLVGSAGDVTCEGSETTLDPALTIQGATFVQDGDEIVVTITFAGDAEAYEMTTADSFPFAVQFRLKEDTNGYPEVFFREKGKLKVSGGLLQVVSHEFSGNKLTIRVKGRTLEDVQGVQVSTFVYAGGTCQDLLPSEAYND